MADYRILCQRARVILRASNTPVTDYWSNMDISPS